MAGWLWMVVGGCLARGVQDMLVLAAVVRSDGKSLAEIARTELGRPAAVMVSAAILFIVVIALAGLGFVVVKALGGDEIRLAEGTRIVLPASKQLQPDPDRSSAERMVYSFPEGCDVYYTRGGAATHRSESFRIEVPHDRPLAADAAATVALPRDAQELVPGSSWGTFTIACTIPIALCMALYMYRVRRGKILEASLIGAAAELAAVVAGNWVPGSVLEGWFSLSKSQTILALTAYGFIASVLPVWLLLVPRDYLSSFLKIGTVALIVVAVLLANPKLPCPAFNETYAGVGPPFQGHLFPFPFLCIICAAV